MESNERNKNSERRREIFSQAIRAGKRTYFFDVKETRAGEYYLTITESKRRFNKEQDKFFFEKHKLFLYKEDFEKFSNGLKAAMEFIETGEIPEGFVAKDTEDAKEEGLSLDQHTNVEFEDLGKNQENEEEGEEGNAENEDNKE